jgi:uncharacterized protein YoxC
MKTLRTIAAVIVAVVLVFGPTIAFAAGETVTATTNATSYQGQSTIQVTGTVSPAPTVTTTSVVVTTRGPAGAVDTGTAAVATGTGQYQYTFVSGGSTMWVTGTYTVNATYGGPGGTGSTTTTFSYTAIGPGGSGGPAGINVQVTASTPTAAGAQEYVGILTSFASNGSLAAVTFQTIHYHTPAGTLTTLCSSATGPAGCTGTFVTIHKGFYEINFTAPATAGGYFIHAWTNGPVVTGVSTGQGQGLGQFTVAGTSGTTTGGSGPDATQLTAIQGTLTTMQNSLTGIQSGITVLTTGFSSISSSLQTLTTTVNAIPGTISTLQSSVNTISQGVSGLTSQLTSISSNISTVNGIGGQLTTLTNAVNNNQTYVLVVAALAAITLVLELAILVRKLS